MKTTKYETFEKHLARTLPDRSMYTVSQGPVARVSGEDGAGAADRLIFAVTQVGQEGGAWEVLRFLAGLVGSSLASFRSRILLNDGCPSWR